MLFRYVIANTILNYVDNILFTDLCAWSFLICFLYANTFFPFSWKGCTVHWIHLTTYASQGSGNSACLQMMLHFLWDRHTVDLILSLVFALSRGSVIVAFEMNLNNVLADVLARKTAELEKILNSTFTLETAGMSI